MDLGRPPEFARDGTPPPVTSDLVEIGRWDLNQTVFSMAERHSSLLKLAEKVEGKNSLSVGRALAALLIALPGTSQQRQVIERLLGATGASHLSWEKVGPWWLHTIYTQFWRREDPTTQLPPGGTAEIAVTRRIGLSQEHTREVATSLGLTTKVESPAALSGQLSTKAATKVALSEQQEITRKVVLSNPSPNMYRRIALWHIVHRLSLIASPKSDPETELVCQVTEFVTSDVTNATSVDIPPAK